MKPTLPTPKLAFGDAVLVQADGEKYKAQVCGINLDHRNCLRFEVVDNAGMRLSELLEGQLTLLKPAEAKVGIRHLSTNNQKTNL